MKTILISIFLLGISIAVFSQDNPFKNTKDYTRQDSLRGSMTEWRAWWDLLHYELSVSVFPQRKFIEGSNIITYKVLKAGQRMQIDLQEPLVLLSAVQDGQNLEYYREGNVYFIDMPLQKKGEVKKVEVTYEGKPLVAERPPWDGGITWDKDDNGNFFIATSNQGQGASVWWPCKDHEYDEPDNGMIMHFTVPKELIAVGNGRMIKEKKSGKDRKTYTWEVVNPINSYGVNINVADYVSWTDTFEGEKGELDLNFFVLRDNLEKAKTHFQDAYRTLEAFEYWFGPYPFYEDSYKLVEVPYLGMEHQSSVTYGNKYQKGYLGRDLSMTGKGLNWDFIIIHESGHEWFANNITYQDVADMWIHEGFTSYSESLFIEYHYGKEEAAAYTRGLRTGIANSAPIIGVYGVNQEGHSDMYSKGHNMLHTIRQIVNDDDKWRQILRGLNEEFYHQTVTTEQVENYIIKKSGEDLQYTFDQYLRDFRLPTLEYRISPQGLLYKWTNVIGTFDMPVRVYVDGEEKWLYPSTEYDFYQKPDIKSFEIDPNFYVSEFNTMGE